MANVCCTSNVSFSVNEDEKEVLQRAHDIIEGIKHDWFVSLYNNFCKSVARNCRFNPDRPLS